MSAAPPSEPSGGKRICVVGSGIAGLTAAFLLSAEHHVTLLERAPSLGMDQSSVSFAGGRIDVPLRTFNLEYYPNLSSLYRELGVEFGVADYSFCSFERGSPGAYFKFYNLIDPLLGKLFGVEKMSLPVISLSTLRFVGEYVRFVWAGPRDLRSGACKGLSFKQYCAARYSSGFYWRILMPWLSVVCTCTFAAVGNYPAEILLDYVCGRTGSVFSNSMQRASSGTAHVVQCFAKRCQRVLLGCSVTDVIPKSAARPRVGVAWTDAAGKTFVEEFDEVVLATQANAALESLSRHCTEETRECLGAVTYERNTTVLHVDEAILPLAFNDRSAVNLALAADLSASDCTIWMNKVDSTMACLEKDVYQTWNPICAIAPDKVVAKFEFERPVLTLASESALERLQRVNGKHGVWFVGAYSLYTMPLLESGVRSSIRVANKLLAMKRVEHGGVLRELYGDGAGQEPVAPGKGALGVALAVVGVCAVIVMTVTNR